MSSPERYRQPPVRLCVVLVRLPVSASGRRDQDRLIERAPEFNGGADAAAQKGDSDGVAHQVVILSKVSGGGQGDVYDPVAAPRIWGAVEEDDRSAVRVRDCDPFLLGGVGQFWNPFLRGPGYRPQTRGLLKSNLLGKVASLQDPILDLRPASRWAGKGLSSRDDEPS